MTSKNILGLDLGTNSIGWALIQQNIEKKEGKILGLGSRIIPMSQDILGEFGKGNSVSQTAERTGYRGVRRLRERHLLRRERLHRILNILGFLPEHYANQIDFKIKYGQFLPESEPKIAYNKDEFIFKSSFEEMLDEFRVNQPKLVKNGKLIPYDWTIYYLRKKSLTKIIQKEELAWIIMNFNQKRGYYQLRGEEDEENENKKVEFHSLKIIDVKADEQKGKDEIWYSLTLENGWIYRRSSKTPLYDWKEKVRDFVVTTDLNEDGSEKADKEGNIKRSFRAPKDDDWTLVKKKTEKEIEQSNLTLGSYIYNAILNNPKQKINGKLVRTIERKFYKKELISILKAQQQFHKELQDKNLLKECSNELYSNNELHNSILNQKDFTHLFVDDIIFYQRPLKSQKSLIGSCTLEYRNFKVNGEERKEFLKVIPKSHPFYQEFRLWQWIYNLSIYDRNSDINQTSIYLKNTEDIENLFDFLNSRKDIEQKALLKFFKLSDKTHRWNFVEDKKYPCNETKAQFVSRLEKVDNVPPNFLNNQNEIQLWHVIYSVTDKLDFEKALKTFALKHKLDVESFIDAFKKFPPYKSEFGNYSEKAIKKLLPLIRIGKYWNWENIDDNTKNRISKLLNGEWDDNIRNQVREKSIHLNTENHFQGLKLWLASYVVYDRHSESGSLTKWNSTAELENYLSEFKQHSLRNPIVEQVVTETLRVVKDVWSKYGNGAKDFFSEIHIELGKEMKNTAEDRKKITNQVVENENTNLRIKALLIELKNDDYNIRPYSPIQHEALKIYEEGVLNSDIEIPEDISKIAKKANPSSTEMQRYKLWLEQKYRSPYTGQIIPLNRLFSTDYEIEHIIPQSRFFDDSLSNKVICETEVNKLKDNQIGLQFIKNHHGQKINDKIRVLEVEEYEAFVKQQYSKNRTKRNKLLMEDIPEKMIERQINDTRYISKFISFVLSSIVREETNDDGVNSKNVLPGNGKITSSLKQDWGLNDIWNELILPRFERMNQITNTKLYTTFNDKYQKELPTVPLEQSNGFQKKRIDHRHHALDALIIACATRNHVNYMNNQHALDKNKSNQEKQKSREDLRSILCSKKYNDLSNKNYKWTFKKPWDNFTVDAKKELETLVVSFKQNLRVINKTSNKYEKWVENNGSKSKELVRQIKGDSWAIRKPMHQETVSGLIKLRKSKIVSLNLALGCYNEIVDKELRKKVVEMFNLGFDTKKVSQFFKDLNYQFEGIDVARVEIYYWEEEQAASRVSLNDTFNANKIESITDTGIQKILMRHLDKYKGRFDEKGKEIAPELIAFSAEGIEEMNNNIVELNGGKFHQPIFKFRTYEPKGNKFSVGQTGNKTKKFVEAAKGTNLFFGVYQNETLKRSYETIPFNLVIERQKQGLTPVPEMNDKGDKLLFYLSPNDLVYVPDQNEKIEDVVFSNLNKEQVDKIYKVVSFTGTQCFLIKQNVAVSILNKIEFSALNKMEKDIKGKMIKEFCIKLKVDRLGNISDVTNHIHLLSDDSQISNELNEPAQAYNIGENESNRMQNFDSFSEQEDDNYRWLAKLSPEQHLINATALIKRIFADKLKLNPNIGTKLTFE